MSRPVLGKFPSGNARRPYSPSPSPAPRCACGNCTCLSNVSESTPLLKQQLSQQLSQPHLQPHLQPQTLPYIISQTDLPQTSAPVPIPWNQKLQYYLPCLSWLPVYNVQKCLHDLVSGLSLLSFQIPLLMSYAKTILHVPPICGLCAVLVPPLVYSIFGSIPQLIVGPEPSISIVVGAAIEPMLHHDKTIQTPLDLVLVITVLAGANLLGSGLLRFGFLDNLLCDALLKGFIGAVGVVMVVNSSIEELGLHLELELHSPFDKSWYVSTHLTQFHTKTTLASACILFALIVMKFAKRFFIDKGFKKALFFPEILLTVIFSTVLSYLYDWESLGISVTGDIISPDANSALYWKFPLQLDLFRFYRPLISTGITCAILGFFESTTLSKLLILDTPVSSNRELVALGAINIVGATFGALPLFGGYGRSKINLMSGGVTCASGAFMSIVTILVIKFLLQFLYFLPNCCLSCITTMVGITILEEIPKDLIFFIRTRGWEEVITFCITFTCAFFISMDMGIIVGTAYSLIRILKNSSKSRIQIMDGNGVVNDVEQSSSSSSLSTTVNGELPDDVDSCLIVKIPEPLMFTNTNDLKLKLRRLEMYGSTNYHPATPRLKPHINSVIFDISEMRNMDSSAAQILLDIIQNYHRRQIKVALVSSLNHQRVDQILSSSGILDYIEYTDTVYFFSVDDLLKAISLDHEHSDVISYKSSIPAFF